MNVDEELELLNPWLDTFALVYGERPRTQPFGDGMQIVFPDVFDDPSMLGTAQWFGAYDAMRAHLTALGYEWVGDGRVLTVPSPLTFNALADARLGVGSGWRLRYQLEDTKQMAAGPFLHSYFDGLIPIHVGRRAFFDGLSRKDLDGMRFFFCSMLHDLSVHALSYHMVPADLVADMAARVRAAIGDVWTTWGEEGADAPKTIGFFLDNDLNRFCQELMFRSDTPATFSRLFRRNYPQLADALALRLRETAEGKGDIAPECDDDLDVAHVEFRITR